MGLIIEGTTLVKYEEEPGETSVVVPDGVTKIGNRAFAFPFEKDDTYKRTDFRETPLKRVILPEGLTAIGNEAFRNCWNMESINLPDSLVSIGDAAFIGCEGLRGPMVIPAGVRTIGAEAFKMCRFKDFEVRNPDCRFGRAIFTGMDTSGTLPDFAKQRLDRLVDHMAPEDLANCVFQNYSDRLTSAKLAELFTRHLHDPVFRSFPNLFNEKSAGRVVYGLLGLLSEDSTAEQCDAVVAALTDYPLSISGEGARKILKQLMAAKNGANAVEHIFSSIKAREVFHLDPLSPTEQPENSRVWQATLDALGITEDEIAPRLKSRYGLLPENLPLLYWSNGSAADRNVPALLLAYEDRPDELSALKTSVDHESLMAALKLLAEIWLVSGARSQKIWLSQPICRYGDEALMAELCRQFDGWRTGNSGFDAPLPRTFLDAALISETDAAMGLEERFHRLGLYMAHRSYTDMGALCSRYFGLDEHFSRTYHLGSFSVSAVPQPDFSVMILAGDGKKPSKTLPKKGADPALYEKAAADLKELRAGIKRMAKLYTDVLLEDFLSGHELKPADWKNATSVNPVLNALARRIVWCQGGRTFILTENGAGTADGTEFEIDDDMCIRVAHPAEMDPVDLEAWRTAFCSRLPAQPFEQVWEPAYSMKDVRPDRYKGCSIFCAYFTGMEKHGIHYRAGSKSAAELDDCAIEMKYTSSGPRFMLGKLKAEKFTRRVNHILFYFDRWVIEAPIRADDMHVMELLGACTAAQITQYIDLAVKSKAVHVAAALQDYKQQHFPEYDAFEEFTLDLL